MSDTYAVFLKVCHSLSPMSSQEYHNISHKAWRIKSEGYTDISE